MDTDDEVDEEDFDDGSVLENESLHEEISQPEIVHGGVPVVLPRARFAGHCNVRTVKDGQCFGFQLALQMCYQTKALTIIL